MPFSRRLGAGETREGGGRGSSLYTGGQTRPFDSTARRVRVCAASMRRSLLLMAVVPI